MLSFSVGSKVRLNELGLKNFAGGSKQTIERGRQWRFIVEGFSNEKDRLGNNCLLLTRIDTLPEKKVWKDQVWTPTYFEMVEEK